MPEDDEVKQKSGFSKWYAKHGKKTKEEPEEREHEQYDRTQRHKPVSPEKSEGGVYHPERNIPDEKKKELHTVEKFKSWAEKQREKERARVIKKSEEKVKSLKKKLPAMEARARLQSEREDIQRKKAELRKHSILGKASAKVERAGGQGVKVVEDIARFWKANPGERPKGRQKTPRTNKAKEFAKAQQSGQPYRQTLSDPYDLNPRRDYELFGQPREYNLIGENKKYDLGFGTGKKHDLGVGKKYDLGVGGKKLDLFGNGNGKKKKNDKFW